MNSAKLKLVNEKNTHRLYEQDHVVRSEVSSSQNCIDSRSDS